MFDILLANIDNNLIALLAPCIQIIFQLCGRLFFAIPESGGFFKVLCLDGGLFFRSDGLDFALGQFEFCRADAGGNPASGPRFVHDVDRFIGQVSACDVAFAEANRGGDGFI